MDAAGEPKRILLDLEEHKRGALKLGAAGVDSVGMDHHLALVVALPDPNAVLAAR